MSESHITPAQRPAAGWYPDAAAGVQRYWDGKAWTNNVAPLPAGPTIVVTTPRPTTNPMATAGVILGAVSLILNFLGVPALLAIIFSSIGLSRANAMPERIGKAASIVGLILGVVSFVIGVFAVYNALDVFRT